MSRVNSKLVAKTERVCIGKWRRNMDELQQFDEARAFLRDRIPEATRALGKNHDITFKMQRMYAQCLYENADVSRGDLTEAVATLEDLDRRQTRIYGSAHPQTRTTRRCLAKARQKLAERT